MDWTGPSWRDEHPMKSLIWKSHENPGEHPMKSLISKSFFLFPPLLWAAGLWKWWRLWQTQIKYKYKSRTKYKNKWNQTSQTQKYKCYQIFFRRNSKCPISALILKLPLEGEVGAVESMLIPVKDERMYLLHQGLGDIRLQEQSWLRWFG